MQNDQINTPADYIPGIYFYCDLWCEKCPETNRCLNYNLFDAKNRSLEFRNRTSRRPPGNNESGSGRKNTLHIISHVAEKYRRVVVHLYEISEERTISLGTLLDKTGELVELGEIIQWYKDCIPLKLEQALAAKYYRTVGGKDEVPLDYLGLGRVVLVGIEKSMDAVSRLISLVPEFEQEMLSAILCLEDLKSRTEWEFPGARKFVRPGLDNKHNC